MIQGKYQHSHVPYTRLDVVVSLISLVIVTVICIVISPYILYLGIKEWKSIPVVTD